MKETAESFAPADLTDGRRKLDWESRYKDLTARREIRKEAVYLAVLLFLAPLSILSLWLGYPQAWLGLSNEKYDRVLIYGIAWFAGMFGGTLFDVKWLYHSVAKQRWHLDRRLWRIFTPHISSGLSFAVIALISSNALRLFDRQALSSPSLVLGISFLVGYFSDSTVAKLAEVADTLFGANRPHDRERGAPRDNSE